MASRSQVRRVTVQKGGSLEDIAERLRRGESYEDLLPDVDSLLGTKMPEREEEAERAFEEARSFPSGKTGDR